MDHRIYQVLKQLEIYQDLLERASISIAKGNYNMLRDNRTLPAG